MARYIIQSLLTGRFLSASPDGFEPVWLRSLKDSGGGVFRDPEMAAQMMIDNTDSDDRLTLIDLDRLGTANDYPLLKDLEMESDDVDMFVCVHCYESTPSDEIASHYEATGWWTCPACGATNGDED